MFGSDIIRIKVKGYLRNITDNEIFEFEERGIKNKDKITFNNNDIKYGYSTILDLVKQYIIKGRIDLPSAENFQIADLYHVAFILLFVIVLELIFSYISNMTRTIHMVKKQTLYIPELPSIRI